jgi:hypothetical protein
MSRGQKPDDVESDQVMAGLVSQLSVAVALPFVATLVSALQSIETLSGQVMTGGVLSTMVMTWSQVLLLPHSSVAVQVRVITLSSGQLPEATLSLSVIAMFPFAEQLSVAVATPVVAELLSSLHSTLRSAGQVMTGAVESMIEIVCVHTELLPLSSVAVHMRVIRLAWAHPPVATLSADEMATFVSQLSVAVARPVLLMLVSALSHSRVTSPGQVMSGGVWSDRWTV